MRALTHQTFVANNVGAVVTVQHGQIATGTHLVHVIFGFTSFAKHFCAARQRPIPKPPITLFANRTV